MDEGKLSNTIIIKLHHNRLCFMMIFASRNIIHCTENDENITTTALVVVTFLLAVSMYPNDRSANGSIRGENN